MRIGILTGGGDCPGLNAVIRAVVRKGEGQYGHNIVGYRHRWRRTMNGKSMDLTVGTTRGIGSRCSHSHDRNAAAATITANAAVFHEAAFRRLAAASIAAPAVVCFADRPAIGASAAVHKARP